MEEIRFPKRKASVVVILLGFISVFSVLLLFFWQNIGRQAGLVTHLDKTQLARMFLESYSGDVIFQLRGVINDFTDNKNAGARDAIRGNAKEAKIDTAFYKQSSLLDAMESNYKSYGMKVDSKSCEIKIAKVESLPHPRMLKNVPDVERAGELSISCKATFQDGKTYQIILAVPYKVVGCLIPFLKEFVAYFDQIHLEQTDIAGDKDNINLLNVKESCYTEGYTSTTSPSQDHRGMPLIVSPYIPTDVLNPSAYPSPFNQGQIFLGKDGKDIFLNLAGEDNNMFLWDRSQTADSKFDKWNGQPSVFCDLWQVEQSLFADIKTTSGGDVFNEGAADIKDTDQMTVLKKNGAPVAPRTALVDAKEPGLAAKLFFLGYCEETSERDSGHFYQGGRDFDSFLEKDPVYSKYYRSSRKYLAYASSLKLRGYNLEPALPRKSFYPGARQLIYGNVYNRLKILSVVRCQGIVGIEEFAYGDPNDTSPKNIEKDGVSTGGIFGTDIADENKYVVFEPKPPRKYSDYMSRIVSGGDPGQARDNYLSANRSDPPVGGAVTSKLNKCLKAEHFSGPKDAGHPNPIQINSSTGGSDPESAGGRLDLFPKQWMPGAQKVKNYDRTVYSRICRSFESQAEFKQMVFRKNKNGKTEFHLEGIYYVKGDLDLSVTSKEFPGLSDMLNEQIFGGIVLASGKITIPSIPRGFSTKSVDDKIQKFAETLTSDKVLVFVSLKPSISNNAEDCIELKGNLFMGVHVVALSPEDLPGSTKMLTITCEDPSQEVRIYGGLAVSTPNMLSLVKVSKLPVFLQYIPSMANPTTSTFANLSPSISGYEFYIDAPKKTN